MTPALASRSIQHSTRDHPHPDHWLHNLPETAFRAVCEEHRGFEERIRRLSAEYMHKSATQHPHYMRPWFHAEALGFVLQAVRFGVDLNTAEAFAIERVQGYVRWHNAREGVPETYELDAFDHHVLTAVEMLRRAERVG